jgi:hypothetical protein
LKIKYQLSRVAEAALEKQLLCYLQSRESEVHILDIDENAKAVVEEINTSGGRSFFHKCNVTQQPDVKSIIETHTCH